MRKIRVVVAMSGGVDSSVAAAVLKKAGYQVSGIFLRNWFDRSLDPEADNRCCSVEASDLARCVCHQLDIPFRIVNALTPFKKEVVDYFISELKAGRTPNPCIPCNRLVRFDYLLKLARKSGADYLATGHYLQLKKRNDLIEIWRGHDQAKDQSYFQYRLSQSQLKRLLFPVGGYTKDRVRAMARSYKLPAANRPDSQDICFIPKGKYADFIKKYIGLKPGLIINNEGKTLGRHRGLPLYTVGQRSGLGIGGSGPYYVVKKDTKNNRLIVARWSDAVRQEKLFYIKNINYISGRPPKLPFACLVQTRYRQKAVPARLEHRGRRLQAVLIKGLVGLTPGQSAVWYQGRKLIGGGIIAV